MGEGDGGKWRYSIYGKQQRRRVILYKWRPDQGQPNCIPSRQWGSTWDWRLINCYVQIVPHLSKHDWQHGQHCFMGPWRRSWGCIFHKGAQGRGLNLTCMCAWIDTCPHEPGRRGSTEGSQTFYSWSLFGRRELGIEERMGSHWKLIYLCMHYNRAWSSKGT